MILYYSLRAVIFEENNSKVKVLDALVLHDYRDYLDYRNTFS